MCYIAISTERCRWYHHLYIIISCKIVMSISYFIWKAQWDVPLVSCKVVPYSWATPYCAKFAATLFWIGLKKIQSKLLFSKKNAVLFFPFILAYLGHYSKCWLFSAFFWCILHFSYLENWQLGSKKVPFWRIQI